MKTTLKNGLYRVLRMFFFILGKPIVTVRDRVLVLTKEDIAPVPKESASPD